MDNRKRSTVSRSESNGMPDFSDPSDFVDDIPDNELLPDILSKKPGEDTGMENIIILDGLPLIPPERLEKLKGVVRKNIMTASGCQAKDIVNEIYPMGEDGLSKGYAFFEFSDTDPGLALKVKQKMDGMRLDKQHIFSVDLFTDFDKYINYPDEWEEPAMRPFKDPGNLRNWLENDDCFDEYVLIWGDQTTVYMNSPVEPTELETRQNWTDRFAIWSPLGSYLATFHQRGLALWGGPEFKQITRFAHQDVVAAAFSPKERYVLTIRNKASHLGVDEQALLLWDVVTSSKKKSFPWESREQPSVNFLKWSPDEAFFATVTRGEGINIFDTETFSRNQHKVAGVVDCAWSPSYNYLAYWVRESGNVPARLALVDAQPGKPIEEARSKQLFSVGNCDFYWQKSGDYLAVKVQRYKHSKKKKDGTMEYGGLFYNLEIFTLTNKKEIPVESVEIRENIVDIGWEPNGNKLLVLTTAEAVTSVSFFSGRGGASFELIKKLPLRHKVEKISWSPMGQFVVLHTLASGSVGNMIFIDAQEMMVLSDVEHFLLSEVLWDPTGRYVAATTNSSNKKDNGYTLYSFQGRYLRTEKVDGLSMFAWRPRPNSLLSEAKVKEIKKNLKKYAPDFDTKDKQLANKASREVSERRKRQMSEFMDFLERKRRVFELGHQRRVDLRGGVDTEDMDAHPDELVEEQLEVMISKQTTVID